jgi:GST-like protein
VLTESAAILITLGLRYPESRLLPVEPTQAIRGLVFIAANCYAAIGVIDYPERFCADCDKATAARIQNATKARLYRYWDMFADQFGGLAEPGRPAALDLLAATVSRWSGARAHIKEHRPAFHAVLERVEKDPQIAGIFQRHWPAQ